MKRSTPSLASCRAALTIVGAVEDVRQNWWNPASRPTIYEPFFQTPQRSMVFLMRVASNPAGYVSGVRDVVRGIDDRIALTGVGTFETEITDSIAIIRIMGVLMALFGCVALALSSVGVYGVLAEGVARRIPEIGVRLALGRRTARRNEIGFGTSGEARGNRLGHRSAHCVCREPRDEQLDIRYCEHQSPSSRRLHPPSAPRSS